MSGQQFGVPEVDEDLTPLSGRRKLSDYTDEEIKEAFIKTVAYFRAIPEIDIERMRLQFMYVKQTIDAFRNGRESVILEAPTGFGKSIFGYALTKVIEYLDEDNTSYMLTPNKFLQEQYQNDIKLFQLNEYKMLKGQGNYECTINKKTFAERECGDDSVSAVIQSDKWKVCVNTCPYIQARLAAQRAKTTVFNYNYWLTSMNHVYKMLGPNAPFAPRFLTVFDETHVLGNIVQDMFAFELNINTLLRRSTAYTALLNDKLPESDKFYLDRNEIGKIVDAFESIKHNDDDTENIYKKLLQMLEALTRIRVGFSEALKTRILQLPTIDDKPVLTDSDKDLQKFESFLLEKENGLIQNIDLYKILGHSTIVATVNTNYNDKEKIVEEWGDISKTTLKLQCTNESSLCKLAVMDNADYKVFMSATLGNIDHYAKQTGIENYEAIYVPQVFDFEKSPIYKVTPMISMNFKNKTENMPKMVRRIEKIIDHHKGERGLVHTGNYEMMRALQDLNHPRILCYANSLEKSEILDILKKTPDAVICGPSLVEGISLDDDLCRFICFMKVPFASMADKLTKRKMEIYPDWYGWRTLNDIMQALGRGVRNSKDWCVTYLLDSSFLSFFDRTPPPDYIEERFKLMEASNIGIEYNPNAEIDAINWD